MYKLLPLLLFAFLFSCTSDQSADKKDSAQTAKKDSVVEKKGPDLNYMLVDEFSIGIPKNMYAVTTLNSDASIQFADTAAGVYLIVISDPKEGVANTLSQMGIYNDKIPLVEAYAKANLDMITHGLDSITSLPVLHAMKLNDHDAEIVSFHGSKKGLQNFYELAFVTGEKKMHTVMCWSVANHEQNVQLMEQAINSFSVQK